MKMFHNKGKYGLILMVVIAMMLQVAGSIVSEYVYAGGEVQDDVDGESIKEKEEEESLKEGDEELFNQKNSEKTEEEKNKESDDPEVDIDENFGESTIGEPVIDEGLERFKQEYNMTFMGATPYTEDGVDTTVVSVAVIDKITATKDKKELKDIDKYSPKMGEEIDLKFEFTLPGEHNYGKGSTLTYPLPKPLKPASGSGTLTEIRENEVIEYAQYEIEGGNVIITFNDNIRWYNEDKSASGGLKTRGEFSIKAKYEAHGEDTGLDQKLKLPGSDEITLTFTPRKGKTIETKTANQENDDKKNSQYVEWTVNVNTAMDDLDDEDISGLFTDTLTGNHVYNTNEETYSIKRYEVDANDNPGTKENVDITPIFSEDKKSFTLNLTGKYAYEIKYRTIPGDTEESSQTLNNTASFGGEKSPANTTIEYGAPLAKIVSVNKDTSSPDYETASWTITVNANRRIIKKDTIITDTWENNADKHELIGGNLPEAFEIIGLDDIEYTITTNGEGFELTLNQDVRDEFTIKYKTKPKDLVTGDISLNNTVVRSDRTENKDKKTATATYGQNVLKKPNPNSDLKPNENIDYQAKTVDWTIIVNSARYTMPIGTIITDKFVHNNLKIVDGTFKVDDTVITDLLDDYTFNHLDSEEGNGDKKGGFILTTKKEITEPITITYTTYYDVQGEENIENYQNKVGIKWDGKYEVEGVTSTVTINDQQKKKGYKSGSYNYKEKEFDWFVGINYNLDTIKNAVFTDTLTDTQEVIRDSIEVYKLNLSGGGNGNTIGDPITDYTLDLVEGSNTFTITFNDDITDAYRVVYKSKNKDDYYAPKPRKTPETEEPSNYTVKNQATLTGYGNYEGAWDESVEVKHTKSLIDKEHNTGKYSGSAKLAWDMKLNWGQSTLSDVIITDEIGLDTDGNPNQMIYKDSFKIFEMNFSGTSSTPNKGTEHKPGEGLYTVDFNEDGSGFTIEFKKSIDKAYTIEYETYFLGASQSELKNTAKLSYTTSTSGPSNDEDKFSNSNFTFSGSASNKKGQLEITKVDKDDENIKLSGAEFELWSAKTGGFLIERVSTDIDGVYKFNTKVGQTDYYLIETKAPEGYSLDDSDYKSLEKVNIGEDLQPLKIENKKLVQGVQLTKYDANDDLILLPGAEFTLHNESDDNKVLKDKDGNDLPESFITDENGKIIVDNLSVGTYYFKEIKAPNNYLMPSNTKTDKFEITNKQIEIPKLSKKNTKGEGTIKVIKVDKKDSNILLGGVKFTLTNKDTLVEEIKITDADGIIEFKNLPYGKYILKETLAHDDYVISEDPIEITLDSDDNNFVKEVVVENSKKVHSVKLTKYNANKTQTLKGAIFELKKEEPAGSEIYGVVAGYESLTTDENGEINLANLEVGKYQLIETKAPSGYRLDKTPIEFEIEENQIQIKEVEKINRRVPVIPPSTPIGKIKIIKVDNEDPSMKLQGAKFEVKDSNGDLADVLTTNAQGEALSQDLDLGNYTVVETQAPEGYELDETKHQVTIDVDGQTIELKIENKKTPEAEKLGKIKIIKTDSENSSTLLLGATFAIKDSDGKLVEILTTNIAGEALSGDLPFGSYTLVETKAPLGYELNDREYSVVLSETTIASDKIVELKVENTKKPEDPDEEDPKDPTDPKPTDPTDPDKPDPTDPTDPDKPVKPGKPDPNDPTDPNKPVDPNDPTRPGGPKDPARPGGPQDLNRPGYEDGKLVQTGTDINMLIPLGFIIMLLGAAYIFKDKFIKE